MLVAVVPVVPGRGESEDQRDGGSLSDRSARQERAGAHGTRIPEDGAQQLLHPAPACLIAIGGFSGSGKSTLAQALAPALGAVPGAVVLRTDEIRKRLCGVSPIERLGPEGYAPEVSRRVYATAAEQAGANVRAGHSAIVDAVYGEPPDREAIAHVAATASVPFVGLWLDAPESALIERARQRRHDASDADAT